MDIKQIDNINFKGKLVILNDLSHKPRLSIGKVKGNLQKLIESKDYDLFVEQDYRTGKINIGVSQLNPRTINGILSHEELPITAKYSRYTYAAKNAINKYESALTGIEQRKLEQRHKNAKTSEIKDIACAILIFPLFVIDDVLHSINPKWSKKFENFIHMI